MYLDPMHWIEKLKERWHVGSAVQVVLILLTFAATGTTVVYISKPLLKMAFSGDVPVWGKILYYILILPVYNILLLCYGFCLGQFRFFWAFEKRMLARFSRSKGDRHN